MVALSFKEQQLSRIVVVHIVRMRPTLNWRTDLVCRVNRRVCAEESPHIRNDLLFPILGLTRKPSYILITLSSINAKMTFINGKSEKVVDV